MKIFQVDAFAANAFSGNPAAVCLLDTTKPDVWLQNVAAEMNLSETAFTLRSERGYNLRWFTPVCEVSLCGHATLATAHVLFESGLATESEVLRFHTKSGDLSAKKDGLWIEMDFPSYPALEPAPADDALTRALGLSSEAVFKYMREEEGMYIVECDSEERLRNMKPDFGLLKGSQASGVIVTCPAESEEYDFVSRFFAPRFGIDEDPVTGSAHCYLTPFWSRRLGKSDMMAYQASARGGVLRCRLEKGRVFIAGQGVTVFEGDLRVEQ